MSMIATRKYIVFTAIIVILYTYWKSKSPIQKEELLLVTTDAKPTQNLASQILEIKSYRYQSNYYNSSTLHISKIKLLGFANDSIFHVKNVPYHSNITIPPQRL